VYENTEKYENLFKTMADFHNVRNELLESTTKKEEEYEYWFRVLNEGYSPLDNIKYKHELEIYKEFAKSVEKNTVNTLKWTINKLLMDFETNANVNNKVDEFK